MYNQLPKMGRVNLIIVCTTLTLFVASAIFSKMGISLPALLGLSSVGLFSGKIWTVATYAFLPHGLMSAIFDALIFWFIGSELESIWGQRRYSYFLISTVLGAAAIFIIISQIFFAHTQLAAYPLTGPGGVAAALCVVYGVLYPDRTMYFFFFPLQAKWFVTILVGMGLYQGIFTPGGILAWAQLGAIASSIIWMVVVTRYKFFTGSHSSSLPNMGRPMPQMNTKKRKKVNKNSHLHIVEDPSDYLDDDDDEGTPPTYH